MAVTLRHEPSPPSATLVIHMGAGAVATVVQAAIRNYGEYRSVTDDGLGLLGVSVFAATKGVSEAQILTALPQRSYATAPVGVVQGAGFDVVATSMDDAELDHAISAIQPVHFDIVLPAPADHRLVNTDPIDDEDLAEAVASAISAPAERLLALFGPRHRK